MRVAAYRLLKVLPLAVLAAYATESGAQSLDTTRAPASAQQLARPHLQTTGQSNTTAAPRVPSPRTERPVDNVRRVTPATASRPTENVFSYSSITFTSAYPRWLGEIYTRSGAAVRHAAQEPPRGSVRTVPAANAAVLSTSPAAAPKVQAQPGESRSQIARVPDPRTAPGAQVRTDGLVTWKANSQDEPRESPVPWIVAGAGILFVLLRSLWQRRRAKQAAREPARDFVVALGGGPEIAIAPTIDSASTHRTNGDKAWVPSGRAVKFGGWTISGPAYVGSQLPAAERRGTSDNCLIDPSLKVEKPADVAGELMDYWPSYSRMHPRSRRAFLEWMASARNNPADYIGYVFVYFYGLERRVILERAEGDRDSIKAEVQRLLPVYGANRSFHRYATELISAIETLELRSDQEPRPAYEPVGGELPASVKIAVGRRMASKTPIDADWLLSWTMSHPETRVKTAARRAFPELQSLFHEEFGRQYPSGVLMGDKGLPLARMVYRAASGTFSSDLTDHFGQLPDAALHTAALTLGRNLLDSCAEQLADYSRFIAKSPNRSHSLEALARLPVSQRAEALRVATESPLPLLRDRASQGTPIAAAELFRRVMDDVPEKVTPAKTRELADTLAKFGLGIVPDPRFAIGGLDDCFVLFHFEGPCEKLAEPSTTYRRAALALSLGMLVAQADGSLDGAEQRALESMLEGAGATADEQKRLAADLKWMQVRPVAVTNLRKKLAAISAPEREALAQILVGIAVATGVPHRAEVAILERMYRQLNLDPERLYSELHRKTNIGQTTEDGMVRIPAETGPAGYAIPPAPPTSIIAHPPEAKAPVARKPTEVAPQKTTTSEPTAKPARAPAIQPSVEADTQDRLAEVRAETEASARLLGAIFEAPEEEVPPPTTPPREEADHLEPRLARLLDQLVARDTWARADFERLARELSLMPGAAIEDLNAWADEAHGEVLIEDGDPITVNRELIAKQFAEAAE